MSFEFLADDSLDMEAVRNWQTHASYLRRDVKCQKDLTGKRSAFLIRHAMTLDGISLDAALKDSKKAKGKAVTV